MPPLRSLCKITAAFVLVKVLQCVVLYVCPVQFDTSSQVLLLHPQVVAHHAASWLAASPRLTRLVHRLVAWDAVYFASLFVHGPKYEHEHVFGPLWWRVVHRVSNGNFYDGLVVGVVVANACHYALCLVVYHLTAAVFRSNALRFNLELRRMAEYAGVFYALAPGGVFLTAPYLEPVCALLSLLAMWLRERLLDRGPLRKLLLVVVNRWLYLALGACAGLAVGARSNAVLLGYMYAYDLWQGWGQFRRGGGRDALVVPVAGGSLVGLSLVVLTAVPYWQLCPQRGEWCLDRVPLLYSYAQARYWNNGFLRYWTPNNIPNFGFALPSLVATLVACRFFSHVYPCDNVGVVVHIGVMFVALMALWSHVQIVTRAQSFLPLVSWWCACLADRPRRVAVAVCLGWVMFQAGLFAAFLPPA